MAPTPLGAWQLGRSRGPAAERIRVTFPQRIGHAPIVMPPDVRRAVNRRYALTDG